MKNTFYYIKEEKETRLGTHCNLEALTKKINTIYGLKERRPARYGEKVYEVYSKKIGETPVLIAKIFNKEHVEIYNGLFA